jgi:hypothetical protein
MPEWVKVLAGALALLIGASAPSLILFALNPSLFIPTQLSSPNSPIGRTPSGGTNADAGRDSKKQHYHESFLQRATDDPVAVVTLFLAIATVALAYVSWRAATDTRRALILAQRPRIRIRNVVVRVPRFYGGRVFHPNELVLGQLYIVNVGGAEARLIEAHCEMYWTNPGVDTLPMERPYEGQNARFPGRLGTRTICPPPLWE